ncbi:protein kinase [Candidatus Woesearchaeota archaeon]|nr:protein kinase [Candidatus Woesearchaeota archaeon]
MITTPIDGKFKKEIRDEIDEKLHFEPGTLISDTRKTDKGDLVKLAPDTGILYNIGTGTGGARIYAGIYCPDSRLDVQKVIEPCLPYASRQNELVLLNEERKARSRTADDRVKYREKLKRIEGAPDKEGLISRLKKEIRLTKPIRDKADLEEISGSIAPEKVVIKFLSKDILAEDKKRTASGESSMEDSLRNEFLITNCVRHGSVPRTIKFGECQEGIYFMETFIYGKPLNELNDKNENFWRTEGKKPLEFLPKKFVFAFLAKYYEGLAGIHKKRILLRDIKTKNIMVGFDGNIDIIDFGLASKINENNSNASFAGGYELYLPQEIITHIEEVFDSNGRKTAYRIKKGHSILATPKSDVHSSGVLTCKLMSGKFPFTADKFATLQDIIANGKHPDPRKLNYESGYDGDDIKYLVDMTMNTDPEKRLSAEELAYHARKRLEKIGYTSATNVITEFMKPLKEKINETFQKPLSEVPSTPDFDDDTPSIKVKS